MRVTIDNAERVLLPLPIRERAGFQPGTALEITAGKGAVSVAQGQGTAQGGVDGAGLAPHVEDRAVAGVLDDDLRGVAREAARRFSGNFSGALYDRGSGLGISVGTA